MNDLVTTWADSFWRASWQAAIASAAVWLICKAIRPMPSAIRCGLWWLVCLRMLLSLVPASVPIAILPPIHETIQTTDVPLSGSLDFSAIVFETKATPVFALWIIGVSAAAALPSLALIRTARKARRARPTQDREALNDLQEIAQRLGMGKIPTLLVSEAPCEVHALGSSVVVSRKVLDGISSEERRMILAHELAHLKRHDTWLSLVPQLARIIFFFHPAAWLAASEFELAREAECDRIAIEALGARRDHYGQLLLKLGVRVDRDITL